MRGRGSDVVGLMPAPSGLTEQQRKFAEGLVAHGNATRAADEAGYAHANKVGMRLVGNPKVQAEVARLRTEMAKVRDPKVIADAEEIQSFLTSILRGTVKDYDLTLSGDVEETPPKLETRRKAAMDLAKLLGSVVNKNEHVVTTLTREQAEAELAAAIKADPTLAAKLAGGA